jgi:hypothetical protein
LRNTGVGNLVEENSCVFNEVTGLTVAYLLKARTVEPGKRPLLANGSKRTFYSRQRPRNTTEQRPFLGKQILNNATVGLQQKNLLSTYFVPRCQK